MIQPQADKKKKRIPYHFGEKLRAVRERKGYTLRTVAERAGVSESLVSQIERNRVSPAIDTLLGLAAVLDINLEFLFEEYRRDRPVKIIRKDEGRIVSEKDITFEEISHPETGNGEHAFEAFILRVPVASHTHKGSYGHLGMEFGFIVRGKAELHYENLVYELNEGDSVSFSAGTPHVIYNIGQVPLEAIWVVTPPQRFVY
ncbi:helix-turn-helix domain-containing protein [Treponema parvum]|uniref:Helix-turn-helix domain-containing protein n=1 Tax=Treponema parvum TaxID=138851 RepID=A0A975EYK4_9SPIR|nr:helix-turn-helix domain-containing protein [Treponema parvum]QTQ11196.1 helix-turn-helix domain-containing protein [Treponema parvum]QTQ16869.1 helix-turn-helix domain-containing protein [Treponema parvum]